MKILVFAAILLIAYWFSLSPGALVIVSIAFIAQLWWNGRGTPARRPDEQPDNNIWTSSDAGSSLALAAVASKTPDSTAQDNRCNTSNDNYSSLDNSTCDASDDSGTSNSENSSSSRD